MKRKIISLMYMFCERLIFFVLRARAVEKYNTKFKDVYRATRLTSVQKRKIDKLYRENFGRKISHIWHRYFTTFTGNFDEKYFPEFKYMPEYEWYMTPHKEYRYVFADKNVIPIIAGKVGIRTPKALVSRTAGIYRDNNLAPIPESQAVENIINGGIMFAKPSVDSSSGRGCRLIHIVDGTDVETGDSIKQIFLSLGENFVIQEVVKCHESVSRLHPESVNTFRIMTYRWKNKIVCSPITMRIGVGKSHVDNAHAGGIFIAVENDGTLHKTAFTEYNQQYTEHPDTHVRFEGYRIENMDKILKAAEKMHYAIPQVGAVNWDFTLDEEGEPLLIEANMRATGSVWLFEIAHGKGVFGENTPEMLQWLRRMRKTPYHKREKINYGRLE